MKSSKAPPLPPTLIHTVRIFKTDLLNETLRGFVNAGMQHIAGLVADFAAFKRAHPLEPFGSKDYPFKHDPLKGIRHAHLTHDISILYTISGNNPKIITLYGVFTHDEIGTGSGGGNKRVQQQTAKRVANLGSVTPLSKLDERAKS